MEVLGVGSTSTCHRCIHKSTGEHYACKIIDKRLIEDRFQGMMDQFHTEIEALRSLHHPNIIQLYDVYITEEKIFIVMELMEGGELFDYVVQKGTLTEDEAASIVRKVTDALVYMHSKNIVHRDLKPENLLLRRIPRSTNDSVEVKVRCTRNKRALVLCLVPRLFCLFVCLEDIYRFDEPHRLRFYDIIINFFVHKKDYRFWFIKGTHKYIYYDMSCFCDDCNAIIVDSPLFSVFIHILQIFVVILFTNNKKKCMEEPVARSFLGTRGYLAPEMLQRRDYTKAVDTWALGVIVFVLLCGCLPFDDDSQTVPSDELVRAKFILRFPRWAKNLSASSKDLLKHLLNVDPTARYSAEQALEHPWVTGKAAPKGNVLSSPGRIKKSPVLRNRPNRTPTNTGGRPHHNGRYYPPNRTVHPTGASPSQRVLVRKTSI